MIACNLLPDTGHWYGLLTCGNLHGEKRKYAGEVITVIMKYANQIVT